MSKKKPTKATELSPAIKRNILAVLQAAEFVRQVRLKAKPWKKRTRISPS